MTPISLITTFGFFGLSSLYPLAKRYTNYPQFVLALCFNSGVIIGCLTANPTIFIPSMFPLYVSGIAWTMIYDTVYAYQVFYLIFRI
jgi:4-hydroxybenzoate polyprenyltransferase